MVLGIYENPMRDKSSSKPNEWRRSSDPLEKSEFALSIGHQSPLVEKVVRNMNLTPALFRILAVGWLAFLLTGLPFPSCEGYSTRLVTTFRSKRVIPMRISSTFPRGFLHQVSRRTASLRPQRGEFPTTRSLNGRVPARQLSTSDSASSAADVDDTPAVRPPLPSLYLTEGLFSVRKPVDWTSKDVVAYIRGILERDARHRGARPVGINSRRNKGKIVRIGHGGTLDPLATGVLVIGVGQGTKQLNNYLQGTKRYKACGEFGFETTTLDLEGNVTKRAQIDHITKDKLVQALPKFVGKIQQIPPIFSAIRKDGQRLYKAARKGLSTDDIEIEPREVEIHSISLTKSEGLPKSFEIEVECGGGTYIRSLVRDIGYSVDSVATTTQLERTQQGPFTLADSLEKEDWSAQSIYAAIERFNELHKVEGDQVQHS